MRWDDPTTWPAFQLCQAADKVSSGPGWLVEQKLDGVRAMVSRHHLRFRNVQMGGHGLNLENHDPFPSFSVLDGEILCRDRPEAIPAQVMSHIAKREWHRVYFQPFDALVWFGADVQNVPLSMRRQDMVRSGIKMPQPLAPGMEIPAEWEGVVCKRLDQEYLAGRHWVKVKNWWLLDALCTQLHWRSDMIVTCTFAIDNGIEIQDVGKATINDPNVQDAILRWHMSGADTDQQRIYPLPITIRHFGFTPTGLKNPHVVMVR